MRPSTLLEHKLSGQGAIKGIAGGDLSMISMGKWRSLYIYICISVETIGFPVIAA
jgi:hypothetical protein